MIPKSFILPFGIKLPPPADVKGEVTQVATAPSDGGSETTGTAARVTKFDVAHYSHKDLLLGVKQLNRLENPL